MIAIVGKSGIDLAEGDVRVLEVQFSRTPTISEMSGNEFDDFHRGARDVGNLVIIETDVFVVGWMKGHEQS